jgi:hypothetical protein
VRAAAVRIRHGLTTLACAAAILALAAPPSVKDVMRRVGAYVDAYGQRASIVVASERYTQRTAGSTNHFHGQRTVIAEFAIVRVDAVDGWQGFRDVIEVDGRPLGDRQDRLVKALLNGGGGYVEARRLSDESARFNIGAVERNFNVPTTALFFFQTRHLDRFKFGARTVDADGRWQIAWRETYRPTFIRTPAGESIPAEGELVVDPARGTVLRTLLKTTMRGGGRAQYGTGRVDVSYRSVDALGMWLPATMEEEWETNAPGGAWERVQGQAVYSNYRQFQTSVRIK